MASAWRQSGVLVGAFVVAALVVAPAGSAYPETREYILGDIDDFHYDGAGSGDDVYVDPGFRSWYDNGVLGDPGSRYANGVQGFDVLSNDHALLFTFVFGLAGNESVVGGTLTIGLRNMGGNPENDRLDLEPDRGGYADTFFRYDFADLGWLPISSTGTTLRTIDLANALGCYDHPTVADNLLSLLQDGKFNVMVHDDEAIDYAKLTLEITPEPASLSLLALGVGAVCLKRRRKAMWMVAVVLLAASVSYADTVVCWGNDARGATNGPAGGNFVAVAAGDYWSAALREDWSLVAWGQDDGVQCDVPPGNNFVTIATGWYHGLALKDDGTIASWGTDNEGVVSDTPTGSGYRAIAGGGYHSLAIRSDGSLEAWGRSSSGQCDVPSGDDFVAIDGGYFHSLALRLDGSIASWGDDCYGQVTDAPTGTDFIAIASGERHCVALWSDGSILAWGWDEYGIVSGAPSGTGFIDVDAGAFHSLARRYDGTIVSWGFDANGQVSDTPLGSGFTAIAGGGTHSVALVPEPATVGLVALGGVLAAYRRLRQG